MGRVLNPVRAALVEAAAEVPPESRGRLLEALGAPAAEKDLERVLDDVTRDAASSFELPRSAIWPILGAAQLVAGALLVFAVAWLITLFVSGGAVPVGSVDLPLLGPIPMPLAVLAGSVLLSTVLVWLLGLHASYVGRRLASRIRGRTAAAVRAAVQAEGFAGLSRVEAARRVIAGALE